MAARSGAPRRRGIRSSMNPLRAGLWVLGLGLLVRPPASSRAMLIPAIECDSSLKTRRTDPLSYRQRGDRCEGVYGQDVAGSSTLLVASLVESMESFADTSSRPLLIEWSPSSGLPVALRA